MPEKREAAEPALICSVCGRGACKYGQVSKSARRVTRRTCMVPKREN